MLGRSYIFTTATAFPFYPALMFVSDSELTGESFGLSFKHVFRCTEGVFHRLHMNSLRRIDFPFTRKPFVEFASKILLARTRN